MNPPERLNLENDAVEVNEPTNTTASEESALDCGKATECSSCDKLHVAFLTKAAAGEIDHTADVDNIGCYWHSDLICKNREGVDANSLAEFDAHSCFHKEIAAVVNGDVADSGGGSPILGGAVILLFLACLFVLRHKIIQMVQGKLEGDSRHGDNGQTSSTDVLAGLRFGGPGGGMNASRSQQQQFAMETVPLAAENNQGDVNDEEWGWEDGESTAMEMSRSRNVINRPPTFGTSSSREQQQQKEQEDLQLAIALSMSENTSNPTPPLMSTQASVPKSKSTPPRRQNSKNGLTASQLPPATIPTTADLLESMPMAIKSLGPKTTSTALPTKPKPATSTDDDLFASLGLSAKPTFKPAPVAALRSTPSPTSAYSNGNIHTRTLAAAPQPATSAVRAVMDEEDGLSAGMDEWGDDEDLDDLLND